MKMTRLSKGFTLVEMSVVLVVIAIITAMGVGMGLSVLDSSRITSTETKMDVIQQSLDTFRWKYGRLPCPADASLVESDANFGKEAANNNGTCRGSSPAATGASTVALPTYPVAVPWGTVPVATLGLSKELMLDGWGRRIQYEVTPAMTRPNAFNYSQFGDDCSVRVNSNDTAASPTSILPIKAVYALVSFGKNGIGGYLPNGSAVSGTPGNDEALNIRGTTTTPTVRYKTGIVGAFGSAGYFDDIVRFKMRYEMQDANDENRIGYTGPEMVVSYNNSGGTQMIYGKRKCGEYQSFSGPGTVLAVAVPKFTAFLPDNTHFFSYHTGSCNLNVVSGTSFSAVSSGTPVPNCPAAATAGAMAKDNGMLALNDPAGAPYLRLYRFVGSGSGAKFTEFPNAVDPVLTIQPENISLSANGEWLALSRHSSSNYSGLYVKNDGVYRAVGTLTGLPANIYSNAISPNGKYYAVAATSGGNINLYLWRNVSGTFTPISYNGSAILYTVTGMTAPDVLTFSPDSQFLAVGGSGSGDKITALYIDPVSETVVKALGAAPSSTPIAASFSGDGMFLHVAFNATSSNALKIYRRDGAVSFTEDTISGTFTLNASDNATYVSLSR